MVKEHGSTEMETEDTSSPVTARMPTRSSARLAEKLKQLMDTPKQDADEMECEAEEQKKRSRACVGKGKNVSTSKPHTAGTTSPDVKRSRNGATPPPIATQHALLAASNQQADGVKPREFIPTKKTPTQETDAMDPIDEDDEQKDLDSPTAVACNIAKNQETTAQEGEEYADSADLAGRDKLMEQRNSTAIGNVDDTPFWDREEEDTDNERQDEEESKEDKQDEPKAHEGMKENAAADEDSSDEEPPPVTQVDAKMWRSLHDEWLHAAMRAAMGDTSLKTIPDLDHFECVDRQQPPNDLEVEPQRTIIKRYDLRLKVPEGEDQVNLFHQAFTKWFNKVREVDNHIILYPWTEADRLENPTLIIENPTDIPTNILILKKFVHKLFLRTTGGDYHIQVLMGSEENLSTIMQTIGWWVKSTSQGMWMTDLQSAEETTCAGWLLFSAGDYDQEALSQAIWEFTGVQVAIRFRAIADGTKKDYNAKPDPKAPKPPPPVKALHIEIDKRNQGGSRSRIEALYSSKATTFPLGIKMRFVRDHHLLTNSQAKAKAECLRAHQERFLNQMETCITWEISTLDLEDRSTEATLRQLIMNIPDPANPASRLFHSVNKMFNQKGTIFRFHPSRSQNARDVVAGLCVYIKGLWQGVIDDRKFNKFFTDTALDRAKDAWWDPSQKCVVTRADEEMASILQTDKDLIFAEKPVIVNVPGGALVKTEQPNGGTDPLSTGSVSTFRTTGTTPTRSTRKPKTKVKLPSSASTASSGSETTLSASIFSEKDISYLLERIMAAMNINQPNQTQNTPTLPGGDRSGNAS